MITYFSSVSDIAARKLAVMDKLRVSYAASRLLETNRFQRRVDKPDHLLNLLYATYYDLEFHS